MARPFDWTDEEEVYKHRSHRAPTYPYDAWQDRFNLHMARENARAEELKRKRANEVRPDQTMR